MRAGLVRLAVAALSAAAAGEARAVDTPAERIKAPTAQEYINFWPQAAARKGVGGSATLDCEVDLDGLLQDCKVADETPAGSGFGPAALALAPKFLFKPATQNGRPVASRVQFRMKFQLDSGAFEEAAGVSPPLDSHVNRTGPTILLISKAAWLSTPAAVDVDAAWPASAKSATRFGHVVLACRFKPNGLLHECSIGSEEPKGEGFGAAARALAQHFQADVSEFKPSDVARLQINLAIHLINPSARAPSRTLDRPEWLAASAAEDVFPVRAAAAGLKSGRVQLDCLADSHGRLTSCKVLSEEPQGLDFGAAALSVASTMVLNPWTDGGEPADGAHVLFTIRLDKPEPAPARGG
jgi:TonB family protein